VHFYFVFKYPAYMELGWKTSKIYEIQFTNTHSYRVQRNFKLG